MTIKRRINELEKMAGIVKEITIIFIRRSIINESGDEISGNPQCQGWEDTSRCRRCQEFCNNPQINESGLAVFRVECSGCNGV